MIVERHMHREREQKNGVVEDFIGEEKT